MLYELLGELPHRDRPPSGILISRQKRENYILEKLVLNLNGFEPVPAFFVKPLHDNDRFPVVLYNHAHFRDYLMGKDEFLLGRFEMQKPPWAQELIKLGYAALCFDAWGFGERSGRTESEIFKDMLWRGQVMWGMMVYDSIRALDYLESREDVDIHRIATMGMSMGSTMAWWLAALDVRIRACVDICCMTDFQSLIETKGLDLHGVYYYVPRLTKLFTTAQINSLISPRPHLCLAGRQDPLTPVQGLEKIDGILKSVYEQDRAPEAWRMSIYDSGHVETAGMRNEIKDFLQRW